MKNADDDRATTVLNLLEQVAGLLEVERERNWLRGIHAAINELRRPDSSASPHGLENARSIYLGMTSGGRGFAEYFIWRDDEETRIARNEKLDQIRAELWILLAS
jgi:hypothetical protein